MKKATILVVEDEALVAMDIETTLKGMGYEVAAIAATGEEAIRLADRHKPDLILMDIRLQGEMDGIEAAGRIRAQADIPIVYLTAYADDALLERAKLTEPFGYILKPFEARGLHSTIEMALYKQAMEWNLKESRARLERSLRGTIDAIARLVELRDPFIEKHQQHVARLAAAIAQEMGLAEDRVEGIQLAATIHDLGLIALPFEVLAKRHDLTDAERGLYQTHPETGYQVLADIDFPWPIAAVVRQHHENLDGSGYPAGLKDDEILPEARIVNVANVLAGMVTDRAAWPPVALDAALERLSAGRGSLYDPAVVDACVRLFRERGMTLA